MTIVGKPHCLKSIIPPAWRHYPSMPTYNFMYYITQDFSGEVHKPFWDMPLSLDTGISDAACDALEEQ